jgi:hypothetical protein
MFIRSGIIQYFHLKIPPAPECLVTLDKFEQPTGSSGWDSSPWPCLLGSHTSGPMGRQSSDHPSRTVEVPDLFIVMGGMCPQHSCVGNSTQQVD